MLSVTNAARTKASLTPRVSARSPGNAGHDAIAATTPETELPDLSHDEMIAAAGLNLNKGHPREPRGFLRVVPD